MMLLYFFVVVFAVNIAKASPPVFIAPYTYDYVGCYAEPADVRALPDAFFAYDTMTVENCASNCAGAYGYWGVEYGRECWCADSLSNGTLPAPESDCNFPCAGNSSEICGAGDRLSVYLVTTPLSPGPAPSIVPDIGLYSFSNCLTEGNGTRALAGLTTANDSMTNELCADYCAGFTMFGTEFGRECYCGNSLGSGSVPAPISDCNMSCRGNISELCGAPLRLNLYTLRLASSSTSTMSASRSISVNGASTSSSAAPLSSRSSTSSRSCRSSSSSVSKQTQTPSSSQSHLSTSSSASNRKSMSDFSSSTRSHWSTSSSAPKHTYSSGWHSSSIIATHSTSSIGKATTIRSPLSSHTFSTWKSAQLSSTTFTTSSHRTTSFSQHGNPVLSSTKTSTSSVSLHTANWGHVGCFQHIHRRDIDLLLTSEDMNPALCISAASARKTALPATTYNYVGLEHSNACYGATATSTPNPTSLVGARACTMPCPGNVMGGPVETCGGRRQYDLYASVTGSAFSGPVPTSAIT